MTSKLLACPKMESFADALKKLRGPLMSQEMLAQKSGVSGATISKLERGLHRPSRKTITLLAPALNIPPERLMELAGPLMDDADANLEPYSTQIIGEEIPLFDLPLAAGGWVEIDGDDDGEAKRPGICHSPDQVTRGLFRVRLRGDSMLPHYASGDVVEFLCIRQDRDGPSAGKDYYVHLSDGTATFKRCDGVTDDALHLRALNKRKYPKLMTVSRGLVVRMARAVAKVSILE